MKSIIITQPLALSEMNILTEIRSSINDNSYYVLLIGEYFNSLLT